MFMERQGDRRKARLTSRATSAKSPDVSRNTLGFSASVTVSIPCDAA